MSRVAANIAGYEYDAWVSVENDPNARKLATHMASKDDKPSPIYLSYNIYDVTPQLLEEIYGSKPQVVRILTY